MGMSFKNSPPPFDWSAMVRERDERRRQKEAERVRREHRTSWAARDLENTALGWLWHSMRDREFEQAALEKLGVPRSVPVGKAVV